MADICAKFTRTLGVERIFSVPLFIKILQLNAKTVKVIEMTNW